MYPLFNPPSEHYGQCASRFEESTILMVGFEWAAKATMQLGHGQSQRLPALLSFSACASSVSV